MATTGNITITIDYVGDNNGHNALVAVPSLTSPAMVDVVNVTEGNVTVAIPTGATAVAILKPANGTTSIILRGSVGDSGIILHPTTPDLISLASNNGTFVLTSNGSTVTVRLFWI